MPGGGAGGGSGAGGATGGGSAPLVGTAEGGGAGGGSGRPDPDAGGGTSGVLCFGMEGGGSGPSPPVGGGGSGIDAPPDARGKGCADGGGASPGAVGRVFLASPSNTSRSLPPFSSAIMQALLPRHLRRFPPRLQEIGFARSVRGDDCLQQDFLLGQDQQHRCRADRRQRTAGRILARET